jgi:hypothetical protein
MTTLSFTDLSFTERLTLEIFVIILLTGILEILLAPYLGFVKPAAGSGVMPLGLLLYSLVRYSLHKVSRHS